MTKTSSRVRAVVTALALTITCFFTVACGDSFDDTINTGNGNFGNGSNFVGQYLGAATIINNQGSELTMSTSPNGTAAGTLQVNAATAQTTVPVGSYPVSGTFNSGNGTFTVNGTIPNIGPFSITGTLPTGNNLGSFIITINNQTFNGAIQNSSLGTPNPPTNGGGGNSSLISGGTLSNFAFNPSNDYNGENPPVGQNSTISGAVGDGQDGTESATFVLSETQLMGQTASVRTFIVSIVAPTGEDIVVGQTYQLASDADSNGAIIALSTSEGTTVVDGWSLVQATTGQATITARDTNSITINFEFTNVGPNSEVVDNPSEGTFSTSGTIVGNFANVPQ